MVSFTVQERDNLAEVLQEELPVVGGNVADIERALKTLLRVAGFGVQDRYYFCELNIDDGAVSMSVLRGDEDVEREPMTYDDPSTVVPPEDTAEE